MTYRNLTQAFNNKRDEFNNNVTIPIQTPKRQRLLDENELKENYDKELSPQWVIKLEEIDYDIKKIKEGIRKLEYLEKQRNRINFENNYNKEDSEIKDLMDILSKRFKEINRNIKALATIGNEENLKKPLPFQERQLRINVMRSRGIKIQELSKTYRKLQKNYLVKLEKEENESHINNNMVNIPDLSQIDSVGLTQEQKKILEEIEHDANERTRDIISIVRSVQELSRLFNELSVLIVEQGSLLDRIDYNVEKTVDTLNQTDPIINDIVKYQKRSKSALCILILILLIILFTVLLVVLKTT